MKTIKIDFEDGEPIIVLNVKEVTEIEDISFNEVKPKKPLPFKKGDGVFVRDYGDLYWGVIKFNGVEDRKFWASNIGWNMAAPITAENAERLRLDLYADLEDTITADNIDEYDWEGK